MGATVLFVLVTLVHIFQSAPIPELDSNIQSSTFQAESAKIEDKLVIEQSEEETDEEVLERAKRGYVIAKEAVIRYFITDAPARAGFVPNKEYRTKQLTMRIVVTDDMEAKEEPKANNVPHLSKKGDLQQHRSSLESNSYPRLKRNKKMGRRMRRHRKQRRH